MILKNTTHYVNFSYQNLLFVRRGKLLAESSYQTETNDSGEVLRIATATQQH